VGVTRLAGSDGSGDDASWRVFLSHTSELRDFPRGTSYVAAVERAISAAGHVIVNMADFAATDQPAAQVCAGKVRTCQVYVGVLGTRYGSPVRDRPEVSYTELEFETASEAGLDRLVFVLDTAADEVGIPPAALIDHEFGVRQDAFRRRVQDSGLVTGSFANPAELGQLVERSLRVLAQKRRREQREPAGQPVRLAPRPPMLAGREELLVTLDARLAAGDGPVQKARQSPLFFDLTISLSKSISIFHASLGENARLARQAGDQQGDQYWSGLVTEVDAMIWRAVHAGFAYFQREAGYTRTGSHGTRVHGRETGGQVSFQDAVFSGGDVDFKWAKFSGGRILFGYKGVTGAVFSDDQVSFQGATFSGTTEVSFDHSKFSGAEVSFPLATFSGGQVSFYDAEFTGGEVSFRSTTFSGSEVDFRGARFPGGEVDFHHAVDWSHPPRFGWDGPAPAGVKRPPATGGQSQ
jgi:hypothetical protein